MSETPKRMKSAAIRADWKNVLDAVQNGEEIVVELYNRPVARIISYQEDTMPNEVEPAGYNVEIGEKIHAAVFISRPSGLTSLNTSCSRSIASRLDGDESLLARPVYTQTDAPVTCRRCRNTDLDAAIMGDRPE